MEYQRKKGNRYILPNDIYQKTIWTIRGYYRRQEEMDNIIHESPAPSDGMPRGTAISDIVANKAERREKYLDQNRAIDLALKNVPEEYRQAVWMNTVYREPFIRFCEYSDRSTCGRWKSKFVCEVAERLKII